MISLRTLARSSVIVASLVVIVYVGVLIYERFRPQTRDRQIMRCLELGSDFRTETCLGILAGKLEQACHFEISNIEERQDPPFTIYEGVIRNTSDKKEHLRAMIGKAYTKDQVLAGEGYTSMYEDMEAGTAVPFKISVGVSEESVKTDIYPWFTTCK